MLNLSSSEMLVVKRGSESLFRFGGILKWRGILNFPQFKSFSLNQNTFCKILAFTTRIHNLAAFLKRVKGMVLHILAKQSSKWKYQCLFLYNLLRRLVVKYWLARLRIFYQSTVFRGIFVSVGNNI